MGRTLYLVRHSYPCYMEGYNHSLLYALYMVCICVCMRLMGCWSNPIAPQLGVLQVAK